MAQTWHRSEARRRTVFSPRYSTANGSTRASSPWVGRDPRVRKATTWSRREAEAAPTRPHTARIHWRSVPSRSEDLRTLHAKFSASKYHYYQTQAAVFSLQKTSAHTRATSGPELNRSNSKYAHISENHRATSLATTFFGSEMSRLTPGN